MATLDRGTESLMKLPVLKTLGQSLAVAAGIAAGGYAVYVATTWSRYGRPPLPIGDDEDPLLDRFIPVYDVVERHHACVGAPAAVTLAAAKEMRLSQLPIVRAIFAARALVLGSAVHGHPNAGGLLEETRSLGWGVLADESGHEIVMGAVTKPWEGNVKFEALAPDRFAAFAAPGYVKIAWTLRADPLDEHSSMFRTETRAIATDGDARRRFRLYWSCASPGIRLIRRLLLRPIKDDAEKRARAARI
jgi:hypothetical protein